MNFRVKMVVVSVALLAATLGVHAQVATKAAISSACGEVLGVDCTNDPGQTNMYYDLMGMISSKQLPADQRAIVQQYLMPKLRQSSGMQAAVVDRAYKALGRAAGSAEESQWTRSFESWQTYQRLVPMINRAAPVAAPVASRPAPPPTTLTASQQAALQSAFSKVWGRSPTPAEQLWFLVQQPGQMESAARGALSRVHDQAGYSGETSRIVDSVMASAIGRAPTPYERAGVISVYGRYWTGADDLQQYLSGTRTSFARPNYGPGGAPKQAPPASTPSLGFAPGTIVFSYNGQIVNTAHALDAAGHLVGNSGGTLTGPGFHFDSKTSMLVDPTGRPVQLISNVISNDGGTLLPRGTVSVISNDGATLRAAAIANIVSHDGGSLQGAAPVIGHDGASVINRNGAALEPGIGRTGMADGAPLARNGTAGLITDNGGGARQNATAGLITDNGGGFHTLSVDGRSGGGSVQALADGGNANAMVQLATAAQRSGNKAGTFQWLYLATLHPTTLSAPNNLASIGNQASALYSSMTPAEQAAANNAVKAWQASHK